MRFFIELIFALQIFPSSPQDVVCPVCPVCSILGLRVNSNKIVITENGEKLSKEIF